MQGLVIFPFLGFRGIKKLKTTTNKIFYLDTSSFHLFPSNISELNREIIKHCKPTILCCRRSSRARRSRWGSGCRSGHWMWDQTHCLRLLWFAFKRIDWWRPAAVGLPIPADRWGGWATHALTLQEGGWQPDTGFVPAAVYEVDLHRSEQWDLLLAGGGGEDAGGYFCRRSVKFLTSCMRGEEAARAPARGVGKQVGVRPCVQAVGRKPATVRVRGWECR